MRDIEVADLQSHLSGTTPTVIQCLRDVLRRENVQRWALSVAIVDDAHIRELNRRFLGHDRPTDVLSFPLSDDGGDALAGEIVINAQRAVQVAERRRADPVGELLLYAVHGCLHLLDYDDRTAAGARRMHTRETEHLAAMGYRGLAGGDDVP